MCIIRVVVLATGGKDSTLAFHRVLWQGYDVAYLAAMFPLREDSWMFHYPNMRLMYLFAEAVNIQLVKAETSGVKDEEVEDLKTLIRNLDVEGLVSGGIASEYQKSKIDTLCKQLKLEHIVPLWNMDPLDVLKEILENKFEVIVTGVSAYGFDAEWLGRRIDGEAIDDLIRLNKQYGVSLVGEGGEYETLVLDAPFFKKRIRILNAEKVWKGQSGCFSVSEARLEDK